MCLLCSLFVLQSLSLSSLYLPMTTHVYHTLRLSDAVGSCDVDTQLVLLQLGDLPFQQINTYSVILHHTLNLITKRHELGLPPNQLTQLDGMSHVCLITLRSDIQDGSGFGH